MRPLLAFLVIALGALTISPRAQGRDFNIKNYGAKGDGTTLDTHAIQAAIDAAAKAGGGKVVVPPGTYLSGSIFVKSNTTLEVEKGATILGSQKLADYPMMPTRVAGIEMTWPAALVNVYEQSNAIIAGQGTIDGDGKVWWDSYWALRREYDPKGLRWAADYDSRRPRLIQIYKSNNVTLAGPLLTRSGFWTVHICFSSNVHVDGITIRNNVGGRGPSTDGIDIDSSKNILVEHADISDNDDAICFKSGRDSDGLRVNRPTEDVIVRDSVVRDGAAAVTFGSETSGGFRNIEVYNIHAFGHVPNGILIKSARTRGGWADNIRIHDLQLDGVPIPINIGMNWNPSYSYAKIPPGLKDVPPYYKILATPVPLSQGMMHVRNVHIWNIHAAGARRAFQVSAFPQAPLENFTLDHIDIQAQSAGTVADAQNWTLSNVSIKTADGSKLTFSDSHGITLRDDSGIEAPAQH
ncbi:MAG TPA: glycosyl hydrolase family 28 protein [Terracidiphilus sp.]|nr:glycosyl hydrolase family 28 protein [Terracidiphilus sp.]